MGNEFIILVLLIVIGIATATIIFVASLKNKGDSIWKKIWNWFKSVINVIFGG